MGRTFNIKQFVWGIIAGVITFGLMGVAYKVGFDRGEQNVLGEEVEENRTEVYIAVREDCLGFDESEIQDETNSAKVYCIKQEKNENTFELLKRLELEDETFSFAYDELEFGAFVTSINNYHPDISNSFWAFYVNDELSQVGISDYVTEPGDVLKFKVEEVAF